MSATLEIRKPITKLTVSDLKAFSVWEYAIDEEGEASRDETWLRPINCKTIGIGLYSQIVASDFVTRVGRRLQGFMIVTTANRRVEVAPGAILGRTGYRVLPCISRKLAVRRRADWVIRDRQRLLAALGQSDADVFPIDYLLRVPIGREAKHRGGSLR